MLTFRRHIDEDSGIDLYDLLDGDTSMGDDLDPWTTKIVMRILDRLGITYKEEL